MIGYDFTILDCLLVIDKVFVWNEGCAGHFMLLIRLWVGKGRGEGEGEGEGGRVRFSVGYEVRKFIFDQ